LLQINAVCRIEDLSPLCAYCVEKLTKQNQRETKSLPPKRVGKIDSRYAQFLNHCCVAKPGWVPDWSFSTEYANSGPFSYNGGRASLDCCQITTRVKLIICRLV